MKIKKICASVMSLTLFATGVAAAGCSKPENGGNAPALKLFMDFVKSYCEKERTGSGQ